jgi:hypothetical protein
MASDRTVAELEGFLAERADRLMRTAVLLTGSRDAGQDLLQSALEPPVLRPGRRPVTATAAARRARPARPGLPGGVGGSSLVRRIRPR